MMAKKKTKTNSESKKPFSMARYLDKRMEAGISWKSLFKGVSLQVEKRGIKGYQSINDLKAHARFRQGQGHKVTMDDTKVLLVRAS